MVTSSSSSESDMEADATVSPDHDSNHESNEDSSGDMSGDIILPDSVPKSESSWTANLRKEQLAMYPSRETAMPKKRKSGFPDDSVCSFPVSSLPIVLTDEVLEAENCT